MLEYASKNSVIKILPERVYFAFEKNDLGCTMKRNIKVYNKAPGPIKINVLPSETEIFTFKHECLTKLVPGIPLTVTIEFKPTKETEYTDWLRIRCQNDRSITLPVIAVPYAEKTTRISDTEIEKHFLIIGPYGLLRNEYLERRKIHEKVFFDKVRDIQLEDSSAERNPNVVRLFKQESEEVEEVEVYRSLQEMKYEESATENETTYPIYLRQNLLTKCDQVANWTPTNNTPDLWIFRYEALWKFIQLARSIIIYNRLVKRMEKLKVFVLMIELR